MAQRKKKANGNGNHHDPEDGYPIVIERGIDAPFEIDTSGVSEALAEGEEISRSKAIDEFRRQQARLYKAKADQAEMERDKRRGELVETDEVGELLAMAVSITRNRLLAIPSRLAPRMIGIKSAPAAKDLLDAAINEAMKDLYNTNVKELIPEKSE
jgi:phage terminase Nu1 subunit (DNA packaging protein)